MTIARKKLCHAANCSAPMRFPRFRGSGPLDLRPPKSERTSEGAEPTRRVSFRCIRHVFNIFPFLTGSRGRLRELSGPIAQIESLRSDRLASFPGSRDSGPSLSSPIDHGSRCLGHFTWRSWHRSQLSLLDTNRSSPIFDSIRRAGTDLPIIAFTNIRHCHRRH